MPKSNSNELARTTAMALPNAMTARTTIGPTALDGLSGETARSREIGATLFW